MKTIKLPIQNKIEISVLQRIQTSCFRFCYNRFKDGLEQKTIRHLIKEKGLFKPLGSWLIQSTIIDAKGMFDKKIQYPKNIIFGGRKNWKDYNNGLITKDEFISKRLFPIYSIGQSHFRGNVKFSLDIINSNSIVFKPCKYNIIILYLPKLRNNIKKDLYKLEELANSCRIPYSVRLDSKYIYITFDETLLKDFNSKNLHLNPNRILGLDMNPNYIGISILEFNLDKSFKILHKEILDFTRLTIKSKESSTTEYSKYLVNKHQHEILESTKYIIRLTKSFKCSKISIEDLEFKIKDKGLGKHINRLCNNKWNRSLIVNNLNKRCRLNGVELVEINPAYSSLIGAIVHSNEADMLAASIEIARRGYFKYQKGQFYPSLPSIEVLSNRWKEAIGWSYDSWKELSNLIKESKLRYRFSLDDWLKCNQFSEFFRKSNRSLVKVFVPL